MEFTETDKAAALKELPKPLADFITSKELADTYAKLYLKYALNLRQAGVLMRRIEAVLLSLAPQASFPDVLPLILPELSNEKRTEMLADIEEWVFRPARITLRGRDALSGSDTPAH